MGHIFGSIFGAFFWAPDLAFCSEPWPVFFFQRLELAAGLLRTYGGPKLLGPLATNSSTYQRGGNQDDFGVLVLVLLANLGNVMRDRNMVSLCCVKAFQVSLCHGQLHVLSRVT